MKKSFLLYEDYEKYFDMLDPAEQAKLIKALFKCSKQESTVDIENTMDGMTKMAFAFMQNQLNEDARKYQEKCDKNRQNISGRWEGRNNSDTKDTNEYERIQSNTSVCKRIRPSTNCNDKDKEEDKDKEINNIVVVDKPSTNNSVHARVDGAETTTSTTSLTDCYSPDSVINLTPIASLYKNKDFAIDCTLDVSKYDIGLLAQKVKESRYLKMFRSLSELLAKYDYIIADKYKDFEIDKLFANANKISQKANKRDYTKEELDALFDNIMEIQV